MTKYTLTLASVFLACVVSTGLTSETKIAVVDMARIMKALPDTKSAESLLKQQIKEIGDEKDEMMSKLEELRNELEKLEKEAKNKALSREVREKKREILEDKFIALRKYELKIRKTLQTHREKLTDQKQRMQKRIVAKLRKIVEKYAKKKGFVLVLDSSNPEMTGGMVVYSSKKIDITNNILKLLDKGEKSHEGRSSGTE